MEEPGELAPQVPSVWMRENELAGEDRFQTGAACGEEGSVVDEIGRV